MQWLTDWLQVETDDGYLLAVQRIDAVTPPVATAKGPAFLYHGIMEVATIIPHYSALFLHLLTSQLTTNIKGPKRNS